MDARNADDSFRQELEEQTRCYEQACLIAADIGQRLSERQDVDGPLAELGELMQEVATLADRAARQQQQWKAMGREASAALKSAHETHTRTLAKLIELVTVAEEAAVEARNQLRPQLDTAAQSRRVMQKYQDALKM